MEFRILGPLEVISAGGPVELGGPKPRAALALLLAHAGTVVPVERLITAMWPERAPSSAAKNLQTYVWSLRRALAQADGDPRIVARAGGYLIAPDPGELDLAVFTSLAVQGHQLLGTDPAAAAAKLRCALEMWRGPALTDLRVPELEIEAGRLAEQYQTVLEDRFEAELALGRDAELVPELSAAVAEHPARERLRGLLMLALYRCGRQADALATFLAAREYLVEELGVEPGRELQLLHRRILAADPELDPGAASRRGPVPAELPHDIAGFAGRKAELARLRELTRDTNIVVIEGVGGVGKTALAVRFAHRIAAEFADGQLSVNLRGFDPAQPPIAPEEALRSLLRGLGVDPRAMPPGLPDLAGLLRSQLSGRQVLILLDNAASAEQVRPLLPGEPRCLVVVTSRHRLGGLVTREGARRLTLDVLGEAESAEVLAHVVGAERVRAEPRATTEIARLCNGLPLALRIAADRAGMVPGAPLSGLAGRLAAERERLDLLCVPGDETTAVRSAFALSYRALGTEEARLFRLLSLHPGGEISESAAAALGGLPVPAARRLLDALAGAHLVEYAALDRIRFHDLIRLHARELTLAQDPGADRLAARRRVAEWYLHTVHAAGRVLLPSRIRPELAPPPGGTPLPLPTKEEALSWFDLEETNLATLIRETVDELPFLAWQVPLAAWDFYYLRRPWAPDLPELHRLGLRAAREVGDKRGQAWVLTSMGFLPWALRHPDQAIQHLADAVELWEADGLSRGLGAAFIALGICHRAQRRFAEANGYCERAVEIFHALGDHHGEGFALTGVGAGFLGQKRYAEAVPHLERALEIFQRHDEPWGQAIALIDAGNAHRNLGRTREALDYLGRALELHRAIGDRKRQAVVLRLLGETHAQAGETERARARFTEALRAYEEIADPHAESVRDLLAAIDAR
ncbi:AfsR/SARP family transcriptional regulator [Amycolatopsis taiwanensis]|uniref:AfsR/SARP family transcriptional regulator n=1 Tax=Amycolatopsis taiwanensis TaxID=342230 RepID=UPI0004B02A66|nr:BTAD domain-containing putative transcriptional regulator [Amycolatopsis taiwanensis]